MIGNYTLNKDRWHTIHKKSTSRIHSSSNFRFIISLPPLIFFPGFLTFPLENYGRNLKEWLSYKWIDYKVQHFVQYYKYY